MRVPLVLDETGRSTCPRCDLRLRGATWDLLLDESAGPPGTRVGVQGRLCAGCGILYVDAQVARHLGPALGACTGLIENDRRRLLAWRAWRAARWP